MMKALDTAGQHLRIVRQEIQRAEHKLSEMRKEQERLNTQMKVTDIADYLGCSRQTVYTMLEDGRLRSRKTIDVMEVKNQ